MPIVREFRVGEVPTAAHFNELVEAANAAQAGVGVATGNQSEGLEMVMIGGKRCYRARRPLVAWFKITGTVTGVLHPATEQIEQTGGTWANGPRVTTLRETNGSTADLTNKIVRAWKDRQGGSWWFTYSACT